MLASARNGSSSNSQKRESIDAIRAFVTQVVVVRAAPSFHAQTARMQDRHPHTSLSMPHDCAKILVHGPCQRGPDSPNRARIARIRDQVIREGLAYVREKITRVTLECRRDVRRRPARASAYSNPSLLLSSSL